jgi:hypothetical protein
MFGEEERCQREERLPYVSELLGEEEREEMMSGRLSGDTLCLAAWLILNELNNKALAANENLEK